ncbi:hypothetical protein [Flavobacterium frigoris]|uniref:Uncharacterized protein n=1 Tax=Flavobacterium frigoris (strain PS1) TaxID=1086011 RepID=H7FQC7_FLAFP|nr:hypothetical protein [Flavobacterium frigoris]EIA09481.1 hypothetical protein HJ01_01387 [Flavobacterium frigoris PS1]
MYKQKNKPGLEKSKRPILWVKRKIMLMLTAFMIGMSNGMNVGESMIHGNQNQTEQQDKKD